jgi:isopentenyldiphosphate isomerase
MLYIFGLVIMLIIITKASSYKIINHTTRLLHNYRSKRYGNDLSKRLSSSSFYNNNNNNNNVLNKNEIDKLQDKINNMNNINNNILKNNFKEFYINNNQVGYVSNEIINNILNIKNSNNILNIINNKLIFATNNNNDIINYSEIFNNNINKILYNNDIIKGKWNNELLPVYSNNDNNINPLLLIERICYPYYGIKGYGVHVNGYIQNNNNIITHLWIGKRSATKSTYPSLLDNIVGGGQPYNLSLLDNVIKECNEEANINENYVRNNIKSTGYISYQQIDDVKMKRDILYCYDLKLDHDFIPKPNDNEVESFSLLSIDELLHKILNTDEFKPNVNLVIIDFFIRHGIISNMSYNYVQLCNSLRNF